MSQEMQGALAAAGIMVVWSSLLWAACNKVFRSRCEAAEKHAADLAEQHDARVARLQDEIASLTRRTEQAEGHFQRLATDRVAEVEKRANERVADVLREADGRVAEALRQADERVATLQRQSEEANRRGAEAAAAAVVDQVAILVTTFTWGMLYDRSLDGMRGAVRSMKGYASKREPVDLVEKAISALEQTLETRLSESGPEPAAPQ
ncbi:MAG: hypothetical protein FJX74_00340 [Armatimonadetes bacterium]|nr:hypothetical protein [Armatimonadota bacterium]